MLELSSTESMRISLESLHYGNAGLDAHRQALLARVPSSGDWAKFQPNHLEMRDLAYLTAKTGHEFAILRGKREDILFHGDSTCCKFDDVLVDMLMNKKIIIYGHSHPGEDTPTPSPQDRETLKKIEQSSSRLISGMSGIEITYTDDFFNDFVL